MGAITNVSYASAHINGKVSASGFSPPGPSNTRPTKPPGPRARPNYIFNGSGEVPETADLTGLKGGTKYFVRLAVNGAPAPTAPPYPEFTTLAVEPPTILATDNPSPIFSTSATATGKVKRPANSDPAFDVNCRFEYVTEAQFTATGFQGAAQAPCKQNPITAASVNADGEMSVSAELGGANPRTHPLHHLPPAPRRRKRRYHGRHQRSGKHLHHRRQSRQTDDPHRRQRHPIIGDHGARATG